METTLYNSSGASRTCSFDTSLSELDALLVQPCYSTPTTTYLGVSPPVRSGAANPWAHDVSWVHAAAVASHSNLEALRQLNSTGESFLRSCGGGNGVAAAAAAAAPAAGSQGVLSFLLASSPGCAPCGPASDASDAEERLSDAGSESTTCDGGAALGGGLPTAGRAALQAALASSAGAAPPPRPRRTASLLALGARPRAAAAATEAPRPASSGGAPRASCGKEHVLEPFTCATHYYGLPA